MLKAFWCKLKIAFQKDCASLHWQLPEDFKNYDTLKKKQINPFSLEEGYRQRLKDSNLSVVLKEAKKIV